MIIVMMLGDMKYMRCTIACFVGSDECPKTNVGAICVVNEFSS